MYTHPSLWNPPILFECRFVVVTLEGRFQANPGIGMPLAAVSGTGRDQATYKAAFELN